MYNIYKGRSGRTYSIIEPEIASGGEGKIYRIIESTDQVLKKCIQPTETIHRKLLTMLDIQLPPRAKEQITWPIDVVYKNGEFVGYVMRYVKNKDFLNIVYSNSNIADNIIIAKNLCAAINAIHNVGQICGDLNPRNILVDPNTLKITLVDTDSFHIKDYRTNRVYRCEVGLPFYWAKEIQEKLKNGYDMRSLPESPYSKETDLFALAVHIFAMLMNGSHPFACAKGNVINMKQLTLNYRSSSILPQPNENICNDFFPFYTKKSGITIPRYAPNFTMLPNEMQQLFIRTFVKGNTNPSARPDAVEWYHALERMQSDTKTCRKLDAKIQELRKRTIIVTKTK